MERLPITNQHLVIAQRIISFVQEQGWDIETVSIERYDERDNPFVGRVEGDDWKGAKIKWALRLSVAPKDEAEVKKNVPTPIP